MEEVDARGANVGRASTGEDVNSTEARTSWLVMGIIAVVYRLIEEQYSHLEAWDCNYMSFAPTCHFYYPSNNKVGMCKVSD